ncbi:MAG: dihydrolipoamide acetyltransferase family protein, partial [Pauljensenia sp.]
EQAAPAFATERATGAVSPRARALAASSGVDASAIAEGSGPHGRVIERDVAAAIAVGPTLTSAARAAGVSATEGTGIGGRVSVADAHRAPEASAPATVPAPAPAADFPGASTSSPLKGVRKVVAKRMMESLTTTAQLTLNTSANAAGILALRKKVKNADEALGLNKITLNDLVCFAVSRTLPKYPVFNAHLEDGVLTEFEQVHLGFACDTPRGLLVPVIRSAQSLGLKAFSDEAKRLAGAAIDGTLSPDYLGGGTFTVSNIGSFGIETFTPVINLPQTAILGVGAITPRPVLAPDGAVGVQQRLNLSLTIDHQVIDGADGARFLRDLVAAIENIDVTVLA